jgi:hypothetical protein
VAVRQQQQLSVLEYIQWVEFPTNVYIKQLRIVRSKSAKMERPSLLGWLTLPHANWLRAHPGELRPTPTGMTDIDDPPAYVLSTEHDHAAGQFQATGDHLFLSFH